MTPLRKIRDEFGYTQSYVAGVCGVDSTTYNKYEKGTRDMTPAVAAALAQLFRFRISEMELLYPERFSTPTTDEAA